jgi:hypothetical protein
LSGATLYCSFPDNLYETATFESFTNVITGTGTDNRIIEDGTLWARGIWSRCYFFSNWDYIYNYITYIIMIIVGKQNLQSPASRITQQLRAHRSLGWLQQSTPILPRINILKFTSKRDYIPLFYYILI